jgi:hypothetical protein
VTYVRLPLTLESVLIGENPCGFCDLDGCLTSLLETKAGNSIKFTITSNCPYYYECMQYKNAAIFSNNMPCTNIPIHCPVCPLSFSGNPQTIWKYNALYHLISEHSSNGIIPEIPGELLVKQFRYKTEEEALGIDQQATERYRRDNQSPDSDGFAMIMPRDKRGRSETISTIGIIIYIFCTIVTWKESINYDALMHLMKPERKSALSAQPHSHGVQGWLISRNSPVPAPWGHL